MSDSSPIPYRFMPIPYEFFSEAFVEDYIMMRFVVCMMRRISPYPKSIPLKNNYKHLSLNSFEFMYGRKNFSKEAGISEKNARTRLNQLIGLGYVEEVVSKKASSYTVYRLAVDSFCQISGQLHGQEMEQQKGQTTGHKRKTKTKENKDIKGAFNDTRKVDSVKVDSEPLSKKQKEDLIVLQAYLEVNNLRIYEPSLTRWVCKYDINRITSNLMLLAFRKDSIKKHEAWMEVALRENYSQKNTHIQINREYIKKFKETKKWEDIKITKAYCTHLSSGKDYQFNLPPENFSRMIMECFEQYCEE